MKTTILRVNPIEPESWAIEQAIKLLKAGEIIAFPTDTVYGVGADPFNEKAVDRIFTAKKRPRDKPFQVLISNQSHIESITESQLEIINELASEFWPGALTMVVPARENFPRWVTCGLDTVGVRMPANKIALELIEAFGPIAATSANISGFPDPVNAREVIEYLGGSLPLIIDGGPTPGNIPSTVMDISVNPPVVLRHGKLTIEELNRVLLKNRKGSV
jgi:L-threonylcarbamoyladenylate synthase